MIHKLELAQRPRRAWNAATLSLLAALAIFATLLLESNVIVPFCGRMELLTGLSRAIAAVGLITSLTFNILLIPLPLIGATMAGYALLRRTGSRGVAVTALCAHCGLLFVAGLTCLQNDGLPTDSGAVVQVVRLYEVPARGTTAAPTPTTTPTTPDLALHAGEP